MYNYYIASYTTAVIKQVQFSIKACIGVLVSRDYCFSVSTL